MFVNQSYDYRPNWTTLSPVTIIKTDRLSISNLPYFVYNLHETVQDGQGFS